MQSCGIFCYCSLVLSNRLADRELLNESNELKPNWIRTWVRGSDNSKIHKSANT